jgi:hypothetical protein
MTLPRAYDHPQIAAALHRTVKESGLGRTEVNSGTYRFVPAADSVPVAKLGERTSLDDFVSDELNHPFPAETRLPFRAFAGTRDGQTILGMTYWHWIADSFSMRLLMRRWLDRLLDPESPAPPPLVVPPTGYLGALRQGKARWSLGSGLLDSARWVARLKRVRRVAFASDLTARFTRHDSPAGLVPALLQQARARGVTLNDVFLTAMAQCVDLLSMLERPGRRCRLALGTIVDLRPQTIPSVQEGFGLFLGFTTSVCGPEHMADFEVLLNELAEQSQRFRRTHAAESSMIRMGMGLVAGKVLKRRKLMNFYRKRVPIAAGISNVNLNPTWAGDYYPDRLLDYLRVSPTGPMTPVVFTPTTLGDRLNLGLTCRAVLISPQSQQALGEAFITRLCRFAQL